MSQPSGNMLSSRADSAGGAREPIAIVGIGCRFPGGADSPEAFWKLLSDGVDAIREIPRDRFDIDTLYDPTPATPGRVMTRWGGFLDQIDRFDAAFFGISPREADRLDPQQRLLLETAWEALEDAGHVRGDRGGSTGVFVGMWLNDYEARMFADPSAVDFYMTTGSGRYSASGRISYAFGFQGPSITIDCACSSSLVAVHLACQSIWSGECAVALAGGANVILQPHITIAYSQSRMMAPDGRCKFGDARANGYVRSEGAAVVVLKPLAAAQADGDPIYAVIVGSAVTNDGQSSGFLATPGQQGQEEMLRRAYANAGIDPRHVHYVEAHGTGTSAGDPVELGALGAVLGAGRPADRPCVVGSVKTNIGHTEGAAGLAGLIKVALSLKHKQIPATLHLQQPNPTIPWDALRLVVCPDMRPWPDDGLPATAGVSSFGIAGTNAHIVLQEAPPAPPPASPAADGSAQLLALSARSPEALAALARSVRDTVAAGSASLADLCYTAATRRAHHEHRLAVAARTREELIDQLDAFAAGKPGPGVETGQAAGAPPKIVFVFPGQGAQWRGMARRLMAEEPAFRDAMERCDAAIRSEAGWSPIEQLTLPDEASRIDEIDIIQPTLFAIQVSLAALWRAWGVEPAAVVGHSMGEVAATCVAGILSLEDAAAVICRRSRLLRRISGQGAMAAVELTVEQAREAIAGFEDRLAIAVSNSPTSTVLSGDPAALDEVLEQLQRRDIFCRRVKVDVASHSPQVDPLRDDLLAALAGLRPQEGTTPFFSTVTAGYESGAGCDARYWERNLRQPVLFADAVRRLIDDGHALFVEISPHPILLASVESAFQHLGREGHVVPSLRRDSDEPAAMRAALGRIYTLGGPVDWRAVAPAGGRVVSMPRYPWQRERFWYAPKADAAGGAWVGAAYGRQEHPLLGSRLPSLAMMPQSAVWSKTVDHGFRAHLRERLGVDAVAAPLPASAFGAIARAAATAFFGEQLHVVTELTLDEPLPATPDTLLQVVLEDQGDGTGVVQVYSRGGAADSWRRHARAVVGAGQSRADWLYRLEWRPVAAREPRGAADGTWLILADRAGVGAALAASLAQRGATCALVRPGDATCLPAADLASWALNPASTAAWDSLLAQPAALGLPAMRGVVYLWGLDQDSAASATPAALQATQVAAAETLGGLARALAASAEPGRLWLVTRAAQAVQEPAALDPAQAPLWGFGRALALEHPDVWGGLVDLPSPGDAQPPAAALADLLLDAGGEDQIALRGSGRFAARLVPGGAATEARPLAWRADGSYLITGGLGNLGLRLARWMVDRGARHLSLVSRSGLPERETWASIAPDSPTGRRIAAVLDLERRGATIAIDRADVAEIDQMAALFAEFGKTRPPLRGVMHAAGVLASEPVAGLTRAQVEAVLRPKVMGGWALHQLTREAASAGAELDCFVLFSSGAAIWGSQGMGAYAAANHFLDALAHARCAAGLPALSVSWGWWEGDGITTEALDRLFAGIGLESMPAEQALATLAYLLGTETPHQVVAAIDWRTFKPIYSARAERTLLSEIVVEAPAPLAESEPEGGLIERLRAAEPDERWRLLVAHVRDEAAAVLGFSAPEQLDVQRGFFKLGLDSIMTMQLRSRLERSLGCSLPPTVAFEYPTVTRLAQYVLDTHLAPQVAVEQEVAAAAPAGEEAIDDLSEEEMIARLDDELAALTKLLETHS